MKEEILTMQNKVDIMIAIINDRDHDTTEETFKMYEKTIKDLQAKNMKIICGPLEHKDEATWIYFIDPDWNVLEYIEWY